MASLPSLIQWDTPLHPSATLPETGIALKSLTGFHPRAQTIAEQLAWLGATHLMRVEPTAGAPALVAEFELPDGSIVTLGESAESIDAAQQAEVAGLQTSPQAREEQQGRGSGEESVAAGSADAAQIATDSSQDEAPAADEQ